MKREFAFAALAFTLMTGTAAAQSSYQSTTTTTAGVPVVTPPPPGTLSATVTKQTDDGLGDKTYSQKTIYGGQNGVVSQSETTSTTQPVPPTVTTTRTVTTTSPAP
jgi:hypothetical protein